MSGFHRLHTLRMENDAAKFAMDEMRPRFERIAGRHENGTAPRAVVVHQLFQTPPAIAARLVSLLDLQHGARVLEPSAGLGRILDALQPFAPSEIVAVDVAPDCTAELFRQDRAGVTIKQRDFLSVTPLELGLFDAVAMNPPFTMRADVRHILRAVNFLQPGGKLAALCMAGLFRERALRSLADSWEMLPGDTFKDTGTRVETILLRITKP